MKTTLLFFALAANAFAASPVLIKHSPDALAKLQERDPSIRLVNPAEVQITSAKPEKESVIKDSTILHDGSNWTIVPNGALVFLPEKFKNRVNTKPVGNLLPWAAFLEKNQSWLATHELTFEQAAANEALPAESVFAWSQQQKVIIAVNQRGPIMVSIERAAPTLASR